MVSILLVAIGLPLGIILIFTLAPKDPDRVQSWMPWVYGIWVVTLLPPLYQGFASGGFGLGFWLAVVMFLFVLPMFVYHLRQVKR